MTLTSRHLSASSWWSLEGASCGDAALACRSAGTAADGAGPTGGGEGEEEAAGCCGVMVIGGRRGAEATTCEGTGCSVLRTARSLPLGGTTAGAGGADGFRAATAES